MNGLLLDTNAWLDYLMPDRPHHKDAYQLVDYAARKDIPLMIASHCLKDLYYLFWQIGKTHNRNEGKLSPDAASESARAAAWSVTEQIVRNATVVGADQSDSWVALKMKDAHFDYEDNLVIAAALRAKPQFLVTNDRKLIAHSPVATVSPDDALRFLQAM